VEWLFYPGSYVPLARANRDDLLLCVTDGIGTVTDLLTSNGDTFLARLAGVWGDTLNIQPADAASSIGFQGQWIDQELQLHWNMFRYYDPMIGRYLSPDPLGLNGGIHSYRYVASGNPASMVDPLGLLPWAWNPDTGMGHHLVPRGKAGSVGLDHLATPKHTPTFFPVPYVPGSHELIHAAQRPHIGAIQGPWTGTADELLVACRKGLGELDHMRGDLKIPATGEILARNVTPTEAFDKLKEWHEKKQGGVGCS
jgi:RHS repeat-associated protein